MFNATIAPPPTNGEEDEIHPVVVKISKQRRGLILSLFAIVAMTYFFEGASQGKLFFFYFDNFFLPTFV